MRGWKRLGSFTADETRDLIQPAAVEELNAPNLETNKDFPTENTSKSPAKSDNQEGLVDFGRSYRS